MMSLPFLSLHPSSGASQFSFTSALVTAALLLGALHGALAVTYGDEQYGNLGGHFYVYGATGDIAVIDPVANSIVKTFTVPNPSVNPISWGDAVYMRDQAQLKHYAFASDSTNNRVVVIDADTQTVISKPVTGLKPLHIYAVPGRDEVWAHLDGEGSFDVFHMSQVRYRSLSGVRARSGVVAGHGKLLVNPNLENSAFATITVEGKIHGITLSTRELFASVDITASGISGGVIPDASLGCVGTHGIAFSGVNDRLYVECSNPSACNAPYNDTTSCTGSTWVIDASSLNVAGRLESPLLTARYGASFGVQGQIYATPEEQFLLVPNKKAKVLHILKPVSGGITEVLEIDTAGHSIGAITYYPKDSTVTFGEDPNPGNYWAVIALEEAAESSGFALLDMALVTAAFVSDTVSLPASALQFVSVGAGASGRFVERGSDYIATPVFVAGTATAVSIGIVNLKTMAVQSVSFADAKRVVWVPIHTGEVAYKLRVQSDVASATQLSVASTRDDVTKAQETADRALALAAVAFVIAVIVGIVGVVFVMSGKSGHRGEYLDVK